MKQLCRYVVCCHIPSSYIFFSMLVGGRGEGGEGGCTLVKTST